MGKLLLLSGLFFLFSIYTAAQAKPDYSGNWTLDKSQSNLNWKLNQSQSTVYESSMIKAMTMKVTQTSKDLTVETVVEREQPSTGLPIVRGSGGTTTYPLDGREITIERESFRGKTPTKIKGEILADGKLSLSSSTIGLFNNVEGLSNSKSIWELSNDGKILKIYRTNSTPLGEEKTEMVFTKD